MKFTRTFGVNLPIGQCDIYKWVTEMSPEEYETFAPAHRAMGSYSRGGEFYEVNVECIGTDMLVQHYKLVEHSKSHVKFYSPNTKAYLYRWLPVTFGVPWEMSLRSVSPDACELSCTIGADFRSRLLAIAAWVNGLGGYFIKRHLELEGAAFARSIQRKFGADGLA